MIEWTERGVQIDPIMLQTALVLIGMIFVMSVIAVVLSVVLGYEIEKGKKRHFSRGPRGEFGESEEDKNARMHESIKQHLREANPRVRH